MRRASGIQENATRRPRTTTFSGVRGVTRVKVCLSRPGNPTRNVAVYKSRWSANAGSSVRTSSSLCPDVPLASATTNQVATDSRSIAVADSERDRIADRLEVVKGRSASLAVCGTEGQIVQPQPDPGEIIATDLFIRGREHRVG